VLLLAFSSKRTQQPQQQALWIPTPAVPMPLLNSATGHRQQLWLSNQQHLKLL